MCGIFGYVYYGADAAISRSCTRMKLYRALAEASLVRGRHASGIAYVEGSELIVQKKPRDIISADYSFPDETRVLIGHCRLTLFDNYDNNANNHPFRGETQDGKSFALMHNGILADLAKLRRVHGLPATNIETDSYAAAQLLNQAKEINLDSLRAMCEALHGSYIFTLLDENSNLYLLRGDVPVYLVHFKDEELYLYASTRDIFEAAILPSDLGLAYQTNNIDLARSRVERIVLERGDILKIAVDGGITRTRFRFNEDRAIYHNWYAHEITETAEMKEQIKNLGN
jgi:glucosamine 6-phosphate synthetase-like amidotransferase/phosphosugar isomerase protein